MSIEVTGEVFIPGKTEKRIEEDHTARYVFAKKYVKDKSVLDVASGTGFGSAILKEGGFTSYTGADISEKYVEYARNTYPGDQVEYAVGDVCKMELDRQFDVIVSFETIEHVDDYRGALSTLYAHLKPGGTLLISSPNRIITTPLAKSIEDKPVNKFHVREFIPSELVSAIKDAGFEVKDTDVYGQRLRRHFTFRPINRLKRKLFGHPDVVTSPKVTPFNGKTPKYFVVVATKG